MGKIERSWELAKASWAVLLSDKALIVFPLVSTIAVGLVMATFAVPMFLAGIFEHGVGPAGELPVIGMLFGFAFYVVQYTIIFYCNSALMGAALMRLEGGQPTVGDGFAVANKHFNSILGYALLAATVGIVLRSIARRGLGSRIIASLFGAAWNIATFLAVPVLVVEGVGPIDAVKRSSQLLKKTWGEQLAGSFGLGGAFAIVFIVEGLIFAGALALAIASNVVPLIVAVVAIFVLAVVLTSLVASALSAIYTAAVYRYATEGDTGRMFAPELVRDAFGPR
jgi:hypothetical protein